MTLSELLSLTAVVVVCIFIFLKFKYDAYGFASNFVWVLVVAVILFAVILVGSWLD